MKFIADENVARLVTRHLRDIGHDVVSIVEAGLVGTDDDDINLDLILPSPLSICPPTHPIATSTASPP